MQSKNAVGRPRRHGEDTHEAIKAVARRHMTEQGTASISLRAIARDLDMTAPALYRYFPSLDDLITALVLDAFNGLADAMEAASHSLPADHYGDRLMAVMQAYRDWALAHPTDFQLIYGNPIPGYHAPGEITVPAAARSLVVVVEIMAAAVAAGQFKSPENITDLPATVVNHMRHISQRDGYPVPPDVLYVAARGWSRGHGVIMLEMFEHFSPVTGDVDAFYRHELRELIESSGLKVST